MKITKIALALLLCLSIISCSSEDESLEGQTGILTLKFDNGVGDQDFFFNTSYSKSNGESYKLTTLKYIISNVRVKDSKGNIFTYPSADNVFIVDEANGNNAGEIFIPAGNAKEASDIMSLNSQEGLHKIKSLKRDLDREGAVEESQLTSTRRELQMQAIQMSKNNRRR